MRYLVLSFICGAALIAYAQRAVISVPVDAIQQELSISTRSMGFILGGWYWAYAAMQIPAGWMADRWGARRALPAFAVTWSVLMGVAGISGAFSELLVTWCLMGVAQSGILPCATKAIGQWFGETQRAMASGLLGCSAAMGTAVAPVFTAALLVRFSWHHVFWLCAIPGAIWGMLCFFFIPSLPRANKQPPVLKSLAREWHRVFTSLPMSLLCLQHFLRAAAMIFFSTWFPRFLQEVHGVDRLEAGQLSAWPSVGCIVGGLLGGYVSDRLLAFTANRRWSRQGVAVVGMSFCALFFVMAFFVKDVYWAVGLMSVGAFWAGFGGVTCIVIAIEFGGARAAMVFSIMNMCGSVGAGLFPIAVAWIVQKQHQWDMVPLLFAGMFALSALCWALFNPHSTLFEEPTYEVS